MKKRAIKVLTLVIVFVLTISMSVGSYAFDGEYFSTAECWDYTEEETVIGNSLEAVVGTETYPDENEGINNYNVYAVKMNLVGMDAQALYDSMASTFETEFKTGVQTQYDALGWSIDFTSFVTSVAYDTMEIYQFVLMESEQIITYADGTSETVFQNMAIIPADTYAVYVTVTNYDTATECEEVLYEIIDYLYIENYNYGDDFNFTDEDLEAFGKIGIGVLIGILVFFILILVVIIVVIVVAVKSSKKKKAQRMAQQQQYNPYGYNPNGQYTPYSQPPVNNGQYNSYGQQPPVNNNQYNPNQYNNGQQYNPNQYNVPQGNAYTPYQPVPNETKDPLDLDNKE